MKAHCNEIVIYLSQKTKSNQFVSLIKEREGEEEGEVKKINVPCQKTKQFCMPTNAI
jgi:hypothetical protein